MLKPMVKFTVLTALVLLGCFSATQARELVLFDLAGQEAVAGHEALKRLQGVRFVLVGEHHDRAEHHRAQLRVIRALHQSGRKVAVGLEMFRKDSQADLDRWVAGKISDDQFKPVYLDNWNFAWDLYRPVFEYARLEKIPMAGLNVPRAITAQVAYHGFESLSDGQRGSLEGITCDVTAEYREFVRRAYGAHGHGQMDFGRFCEAQLVWDSAMAIHAIDSQTGVFHE